MRWFFHPEYSRRLTLAKDQVLVGGALHPYLLETHQSQLGRRLPLWRFGAWAAALKWPLPDDFSRVMPPESAEPQAAPVVTESASNAPASHGNIMKKAALIAELEYEWPSIKPDMSDAKRNELKAAAHTGNFGKWDRDKARAWAVSRGKIKQNAPVHSLVAAWHGPVTRNTIGD